MGVSVGSGSGVGVDSDACTILAPAPITPPVSAPITVAFSTPSNNGLPNAAFAHICSCIDCGISSKMPSDIPPATTRFPTSLVLLAIPFAIFFGTVALPPASNVSTSLNPNFLASLAPTILNAPVPTPEATADRLCPGVNNSSSVCCRIPSAEEPAPTSPSPIAAAIQGATLIPFAIVPPAPINGADSIAVCAITLGFLTAVFSTFQKPSASSTDCIAFC